ncbi:MAG: TA system VapC family ribonuclease toxin [Limnohabitans sp.]
MTPDVNVLVSAYRPDHPHHLYARLWLEETVRLAANGRSSLVLLGMVVAGFIRITTHPQIFREIDPMQDVSDFIESLLSYPGVQFQAHSATWPHLQQLCLTQRVRGNLVSDAWIAATVMQSGETLCTFDRDFTRLLPNNHLNLLKP